MSNQPTDLRRIKALVALSKLSTRLWSDVLADGSIAARFDLGMADRANLSPDVVLRRDELFAAFRGASDETLLLRLNNELGGQVEARVSIDADGAGIVTTATKSWRFPDAALLSSSVERRFSALKNCLAQHTLTSRDRDYLHEFIGRLEFSNEDFLTVVTMLASSPESFADRLRQRLEFKRIGKADLLPEDIRHWEHLTAPLGQSSNLVEFIDGELAAEWRTRLSADPEHAFRSIALTFASPALVPRSLFEDVDNGTMIRFLESACGFADPFALAGAFQICADRLGQDMRFVGLGDRLLDRLVGDMHR